MFSKKNEQKNNIQEDFNKKARDAKANANSAISLIKRKSGILNSGIYAIVRIAANAKENGNMSGYLQGAKMLSIAIANKKRAESYIAQIDGMLVALDVAKDTYAFNSTMQSLKGIIDSAVQGVEDIENDIVSMTDFDSFITDDIDMNLVKIDPSIDALIDNFIHKKDHAYSLDEEQKIISDILDINDNQEKIKKQSAN